MLLIPILYIYKAGDYESTKQFSLLIRETTSSILFNLIALVSFVFWIYNIITWYKKKDTLLNLLLLLFFNIFYAPIYYIRNFPRYV